MQSHKCRSPSKEGPRLHEGEFRHRGAGWEAIRSHLGRTCPWYEGDGLPSFLHAHQLSTTLGGYLSRSVVKFLTRPGCHLCDAVRALVQREVARQSLDLVEIDIDQDDYLVAEYGLRIPVVLSGGQVLAEGEIGQRSLRRRLKRLG